MSWLTRARKGINHGVVVIPEGLIEFVPQLTRLIAELNDADQGGYTWGGAAADPGSSIPDGGFIIGYNPCRPTSRGRIDIESPDPSAAPRIPSAWPAAAGPCC